MSTNPSTGTAGKVPPCVELVLFTAGCKSIDQNRPMHTLALSFSPGMEPNNGAHYTSFAMLT